MRKGFTIVELFVAVVLCAIFTALGLAIVGCSLKVLDALRTFSWIEILAYSALAGVGIGGFFGVCGVIYGIVKNHQIRKMPRAKRIDPFS